MVVRIHLNNEVSGYAEDRMGEWFRSREVSNDMTEVVVRHTNSRGRPEVILKSRLKERCRVGEHGVLPASLTTEIAGGTVDDLMDALVENPYTFRYLASSVEYFKRGGETKGGGNGDEHRQIISTLEKEQLL